MRQNKLNKTYQGFYQERLMSEENASLWFHCLWFRGGHELIACTPFIKLRLQLPNYAWAACLLHSLKTELFQEGSFSPSFTQIQEHVCNNLCRLMSLTSYTEWIFIPSTLRWRWCNIKQKGKWTLLNDNSEVITKGIWKLQKLNCNI